MDVNACKKRRMSSEKTDAEVHISWRQACSHQLAHNYDLQPQQRQPLSGWQV